MPLRADIALVSKSGAAAFTAYFGPIKRLLSNFGLSAETFGEDELGNLTGGGTTNAATTAAFLSANYRAVIYAEDRNIDNASVLDRPYQWLNTITIPVAYLGAYVKSTVYPLGTGHNPTLAPMPNFPIVGWAADNWRFIHDGTGDASGTDAAGKALGTRAVHKSGEKLWGRFFNAYRTLSAPTRYLWSAYKVDPALMAAHGDSEIILSLDTTVHAGATASDVLMLRVGKGYFCPAIATAGNYKNGWDKNSHDFCFAFICVLLFLEEAGIAPNFKMPVLFDIDHPLDYTHGTETYADNHAKALATYRWMEAFCDDKGATIQQGVLTGGLARSGGQKEFITLTAAGDALHKLLINRQNSFFPCCWHDHTYNAGLGTQQTNFDRHDSTKYDTTLYPSAYAAPVNVGQWGTAVRAATITIDTLDEFNCLYEGSLIEMKMLGFADATCGQIQYLNTGYDSFGNLQHLEQMARFTPVRALRIGGTATQPGGGDNPFFAMNNRFRRYVASNGVAIELIESQDPFSTHYGSLYNANGSGTTLNAGLGLNAADEPQARHRCLAYVADTCMFYAMGYGRLTFTHGGHCVQASLAAPVSEYDDTGNWNGIKELLTAMNEYIQLVPSFLRWGSPADLVAWRNKMRDFWRIS